MDNLIEISVRGSIYYFLSSLNSKQLADIKQFSRQFHEKNQSFDDASDDIIAEQFTLAIEQVFGIPLTRISVATVIVIK
jgi:hypothetical protein